MDVVEEFFVEGVACQGGGVTQDEEFHAGAGNGDVHATQVAQEADLPGIVGPHERDEDDVALLALEPVDSVDRYQMAEGLEEGAFPDDSF